MKVSRISSVGAMLVVLSVGCRAEEPVPHTLRHSIPSSKTRIVVVDPNKPVEGGVRFFGFTFPRRSEVAKQSPSAVEVTIPYAFDDALAYVKDRVTTREVRKSYGHVIFENARIDDDASGALYTLTLKRDGARARLVIRPVPRPDDSELATLAKRESDRRPTTETTR